MPPWSSHLPMAWLQLTHSRTKFAAAVSGVLVAVLLMWMQLGFLDALYRSATAVARSLKGDLVLLSPQTKTFTMLEPIARVHLSRALGHPNVETAQPLYNATAKWKNPWNGEKRAVFVYGMPPEFPVFDATGLEASWDAIREPDFLLFDEGSRPEFGPVGPAFRRGETIIAEVNTRQMRVAGIVFMGAGFQADGNVITSDTNFFRIFPEHRPGVVHLGVVKLKPGSNVPDTQRELQALFGKELLVMTTAELVEKEYAFLREVAPIGFIFSLGTAVGCFVGFAIVYQMLYTDITNHLPQYATLKAMGYTDRYLLTIVLSQAGILACCGFLPGSILAAALYELTRQATLLPIFPTSDRAVQVLLLTFGMCALSGAIAVRKLNSADPAEIF